MPCPTSARTTRNLLRVTSRSIAADRFAKAVRLGGAPPGGDLPRKHQEAVPHDAGALPDPPPLVQIVDLDHRPLRRNPAPAAFPMARWTAAKTSSAGPDASTLRRTPSRS